MVDEENKSGPRLAATIREQGADEMSAALVGMLEVTAEHPDVRARLMGSPIVIARSAALRALDIAGVKYP